MARLEPNIQLDIKEKAGITIVFCFLSIYLLIRSQSVFYIHDELVTKWAYMINWNPWPYMGYLDANNHFLNSLLGGLFIRVFDSDSLWVVRLPNLLCFPVFYWSLYKLKRFFTLKANYYGLICSVVLATFLLEYFALARGYGMSMAWFVFALYHLLVLAEQKRFINYLWTSVGWFLAVYANLTFLAIALFALVYTVLFLLQNKRVNWLWISLLNLAWYVYAVRYSLDLKKVGKLYLGESDGFIQNTLETLTPYIWGTDHLVINIALIIVFIGLTIKTLYKLVSDKSIFVIQCIFPIFLIVGIIGIFAQHWILSINFPHSRAALYLIILFFGALFFVLDDLRYSMIGYILSVLAIIAFLVQANFTHSIYFHYEHFDKELLELIPNEVLGTPPSTGGRFWRMDNGLTQKEHLPVRAFQDGPEKEDTLYDYVITTPVKRPDINQLYHPVHVDRISNLTLYERNSFLNRKHILESEATVNGINEFTNLYVGPIDGHSLAQVYGTFSEMNRYKQIFLVCTTEDQSGKTIEYQSVPITETAYISDQNTIKIDLSVVMKYSDSTARLKVYIWNRYLSDLKGELSLNLFTLSDSTD